MVTLERVLCDAETVFCLCVHKPTFKSNILCIQQTTQNEIGSGKLFDGNHKMA